MIKEKVTICPYKWIPALAGIKTHLRASINFVIPSKEGINIFSPFGNTRSDDLIENYPLTSRVTFRFFMAFSANSRMSSISVWSFKYFQ
jgi:hypothetical protein